MYDVIVVGAGPAGSTAAKVLAEKGHHILLVERHKLPRYKSCSGVLIRKTMDLVRRYYGQDVPLSATCTPLENRGMIFTDDKGREFRFEQGGLNVWRGSFDNWLTERAAASGAEVRDNTSAVFCEEQPGSNRAAGQSGKVVEAPHPARLPCHLWAGPGAVRWRDRRVSESDGRGHFGGDGERLLRGPGHSKSL